MPGRIALERFGSSSPDDDALAAGVNMPVPDHEAAPVDEDHAWPSLTVFLCVIQSQRYLACRSGAGQVLDHCPMPGQLTQFLPGTGIEQQHRPSWTGDRQHTPIR